MAIEGVTPEVDGGRFPVKRVPGEEVRVEADVFADGHDLVAAALRVRRDGDDDVREIAMQPLGNDRFVATFEIETLVEHRCTIAGWIDRFGSWTRDVRTKIEADVDVDVDLLVGAQLATEASRRADGDDRARLKRAAERLAGTDPADARSAALEGRLAELMQRYPDRRGETVYERELRVTVDPPRAGFSAWYELFPRSAARVPGRHGTFADVIERLSYVERLGFDVLYLPPIHPIGHDRRKGPNNSRSRDARDPGSPWAIGAREGGHTAIHPQLGTIDDLERLVREARARGIDVALDIAFQATPEHPWVTEHPEWFRHRPDGSIQHAENPPKVYEDIYPLDFDTKDRRGLWGALRDVFLFWCGHGVRFFRVDNPHTKPFAFWEWAIAEVRDAYPDAVFLAEAFTRPKVMYRLAKLGFTQSYTYFTWRNTKDELTEYLTELTRSDAVEYFRPNFWPNTPDILHESLQTGGRGAFASRLVLAATLSSNYGIYGPAFELQQRTPREPGSEEYRDSEKYEIRSWDLEQEDSLAPLIERVNRIRHDHPALRSNRTLRFHGVSNDTMIAYSKRTPDGSDVVLVVVNLDPFNVRAGWTNL
ncbi:MAG TPA: alpha-1,4-glucan--maltose-1-phosphate maltosyltransferase, partial [Actinomycetota bacterium]|nr:alpha-1,4-glucan--maltose-1-phosphate maltosyltransferase [Actinomycetota bacterium]